MKMKMKELDRILILLAVGMVFFMIAVRLVASGQ